VEETKARLNRWLVEVPDLMKPGDVSKTTGYALNTVVDWCSSGRLHSYLIRRAFLIPKLSLIDFMVSDIFKGIKVKTDDYETFMANFQKI
jgi:hypothetical protein